MKRKIAVILASDVSSYSRLIAVDEEATLSRFDAAAKLFKDLVARYKGRVFNTAGDAILAEFDSAVVAVRCALHIQYATEALDPSTPLDQRLRFRMGIAMGDVVITDNEDLLGDSVNIAARLEGLAEPGGICVAKDIQAAVAGKIKVEFTDLGEKALKNIPRPVQVFRLKAMPTTRVLIATTVGPVQIDSIIEEDKRVPKSLACIANTSNRSSIDTAYAAFVARGTGVIERLYAPGPYRLDISADITKDSASWQLGVFVAHALYANGRLASEKQDAGTVVWATGQVRPLDLSVTGVGYVGQKIRLSLAQLRTEAEAGRKIIAAWPKVNTTDIDPDILEELEKLGAKLFDLESINPILPALGLPSHAANPEKGTWQGSPFRGLEPFDESHRDVFFGRGRAREEALERLRTAAAQDCAFLLVHGRSGAGKSSLVRAGMIGDIAASASEARVWRHTVFRPGGAGSPVRALADAVIKAMPELQQGTEELAALIQDRPADAASAIANAIAQIDGLKLVLVVDQLEEALLWTREEKAERAAKLEAFAETLARLARSGRVWVIATLRSDLIALLEDCPALSRLASDDRLYRLERPTRAEFKEIVLRPAAAAQLKLEGSDPDGLPLAEVLIEAATAAPDSLPLLQFVFARLYDQGGHTGVLTYTAYDRMGGLEGAIGRWADEVIRRLDDTAEMHAAIDRVILDLGTLDPDTGTTIARTIVLDTQTQSDTSRRVFDAFANARLVVLDTAGQLRTARVAHEAVLNKWPGAIELFLRQRNSVKLRDRLEQQATDWLQNKMDAAVILRPGRPIEEARALLADGTISISKNVQDYIRASLAGAADELEKEKRKVETTRMLQRRVAWALCAVALLVSFITLGAIVGSRAVQRRAAIVFVSRAAEAMRSENYERALRYALMAIPAPGEAPWAPSSPAAEAILSGAASMSRIRMRFSLEGAWGAFLPKTNLIATVDTEGFEAHEIKLWDRLTGALATTLEGPRTRIEWFDWWDGKRVVATSFRSPATLWSIPDGKIIARLGTDDDEIVGAFFDGNGRIATIDYAHGIRLWNANTGMLMSPGKGVPLPYQVPLHQSHLIRWRPLADQFLIVAGAKAYLIGLENGAIKVSFDGLVDDVLDVRFSSDGRYLAMASETDARLWDAETGQEIATLDNAKTFAFSRDSKILATGHGGQVRLWSPTDGKLWRTISASKGNVTSIAFASDLLAVSLDDGAVRIWGLGSGNEVAAASGYSSELSGLDVSEDGRTLLTIAKGSRRQNGEKGRLRVYDVPEEIGFRVLLGHADWVNSATFDPSGKRIVTASEDKTVRVWDALSGGLVTTIGAGTSPISSAYFSELEQLVIAYSSGKVTLNGISNGTSRELSESAGNELHVTKDGQFALLGQDIFDLPRARKLATLQYNYFKFGAFSADLRKLVTLDQCCYARVFDILSGKQLQVLSGHTSLMRSAKFSRDGQHLVTTSFDDTARVWDVGSGKVLATFKGHTFPPNDAVFTADGSKVISAGQDGTVRMWNASNGQQLASTRKIASAMRAIFLSPDLQRIAVVSGDHSVHILDASTLTEMADLRVRSMAPETRGLFGDGEVTWSRDGTHLLIWFADSLPVVWSVPWLGSNDGLFGRICSEVLSPEGMQFTEEELADPILRDHNAIGSYATPCHRRGPLSLGYYFQSAVRH